MAIGGKKIRVLVVDDSILARKLIIDGLSKYPNIEVVGYAINAVDARSKVKQLKTLYLHALHLNIVDNRIRIYRQVCHHCLFYALHIAPDSVENDVMVNKYLFLL